MSDVTDPSTCGRCNACLWVSANGPIDEATGNLSYPACEAGQVVTDIQTTRREESDHE